MAGARGAVRVSRFPAQEINYVGRNFLAGVRKGAPYADAAWRPRPREPPVTTAILPSSEKSEGKSLSSDSAIVARFQLQVSELWGRSICRAGLQLTTSIVRRVQHVPLGLVLGRD